jgi:predicted deacylase
MSPLHHPLLETVAGPVPGPTLTFTILMHGDEGCGLAARDVVLDCAPRLKRGRINIVTLNPEARNAGGGPRRFLDFDLNRLWGDDPLPDSYEGRRIAEVLPLLEGSDAILDIHSLPGDTGTFSLVSDERPAALAMAQSLAAAIPRIVIAPAPANRGRALFQTTRLPASVPIVVIECGQHDAPASGEIARAATLAFLERYDMLAGDRAAAPPPESRCYRIDSEHKATHGPVRFIGRIGQFEPLPAGQPFAMDGDWPLFALAGQSLLLRRDARKPGDEAFALVREVSTNEINEIFSLRM